MITIIDSVSPTAAVASGPSLETQKMSATAKMDSIPISRTMGTASNRMARPSGILVRSGRDPRSDSRTRDQKFSGIVSDVAMEGRRDNRSPRLRRVPAGRIVRGGAAPIRRCAAATPRPAKEGARPGTRRHRRRRRPARQYGPSGGQLGGQTGVHQMSGDDVAQGSQHAGAHGGVLVLQRGDQRLHLLALRLATGSRTGCRAGWGTAVRPPAPPDPIRRR